MSLQLECRASVSASVTWAASSSTGDGRSATVLGGSRAAPSRPARKELKAIVPACVDCGYQTRRHARLRHC